MDTQAYSCTHQKRKKKVQFFITEEMADGYWNGQPSLHTSAGLLKRPRYDYGKLFHALISISKYINVSSICVRAHAIGEIESNVFW